MVDLAKPSRLPQSWFKAVGVVVLLIACILGGNMLYRHLFPEWLVRQARESWESGDMKSAMLRARHALRVNPRNVSAIRLLAEWTDEANVPEAVFWRYRVFEQRKGDFEDAVALVQTATKHRAFGIAQKALDSISREDQSRPEYQVAVGDLAYARRHYPEALQAYEAAAKADPQNQRYSLKLAAMQLQQPDLLVSQAAKETIEKLTSDPALGAEAMRVLIKHLRATGQFFQALRRNGELLTLQQAAFADKVMQADLLLRTKNEQFSSYFENLKNEAVKKPSDTATLVNWMNTSGRTKEVMEWSRTFPKVIANSAQVGMFVSVSYLDQKNWDGLQTWLSGADWGNLEYLRLALLARLSRMKGDDEAFGAQWKSALTAAGPRGESMFSLAKTVSTWGWDEEARDIYWDLAKSGSNAAWALANLYDYYAGKRDTFALRRVVSQMVAINPKDDVAKNNLAMLSLLLRQNPGQALFTAQDLYERLPEDPSVVSTFAFALYQNNNLAEARRVMTKLPEDQLLKPGIALYQGLILKAAGEHQQAHHYLTRAMQGNLLPEEESLLQDAMDDAN